MALILFDDHSWDNLLPLTFTRPVSALRVGIKTIAEKWEHDLKSISTPLTKFVFFISWGLSFSNYTRLLRKSPAEYPFMFVQTGVEFIV